VGRRGKDRGVCGTSLNFNLVEIVKLVYFIDLDKFTIKLTIS
jgi:hypothetical protein